MPEMHFVVRWPEGDDLRCYSPSLVVRDYLEVGRDYPVDEFIARCRTLLDIASERCMSLSSRWPMARHSLRRNALPRIFAITVTALISTTRRSGR